MNMYNVYSRSTVISRTVKEKESMLTATTYIMTVSHQWGIATSNENHIRELFRQNIAFKEKRTNNITV